MSGIGMQPQSPEERRQFEETAVRLVELAAEGGLTLRLLGSLAFQIHCNQYGHLQEEMGRAYTDIDYAAYSDEAHLVDPFLTSLGYRGEAEINLYFAGERMIFHDPTGSFHVDVFFDKLAFCHEIDWTGRLHLDSPTIPLAELLLEKMQIVKINEKDIIDTIMLLLEHPLGDDDSETINIALVSQACASDWGLWRTVTMNLEKVATLSATYDELGEQEKKMVSAKVTGALERIEEEPKTLGWKTRSLIGDRVKWYQDVEDLV